MHKFIFLKIFTFDYSDAGDSPTHEQTDNTPTNAQSNTPAVNFLATVDDQSVSSTSDRSDADQSDSEQEEVETKERLPNPMALGSGLKNEAKLPSPALIGKTLSGAVPGSVFINPYAKAEEAKNSILEKHVKMTTFKEVDSKTARHNKKLKKKICYQFLKGNCRHGKKCKYNHDMAAKVPEDSSSGGGGANEIWPDNVPDNRNLHYGSQSWQEPVENYDQKDDDSYMAEARRKKRFGVTDTMAPPKKAMKFLDQQRAVERPWTVQEQEGNQN